MTTESQELPKNVRHLLEQTWLRIGLGKVALANCLAGREALAPDEILLLTHALVET
ncbi:MAG: hypothetical protein ACE5OZ_01155 [Candidatus Heimdallarchaeota archaeon]